MYGSGRGRGQSTSDRRRRARRWNLRSRTNSLAEALAQNQNCILFYQNDALFVVYGLRTKMYVFLWFRVYGPKITVLWILGFAAKCLQIPKLPFSGIYGLRPKIIQKSLPYGLRSKFHWFWANVHLYCFLEHLFSKRHRKSHLWKMPFRTIKWLPSIHIGESVAHRFAPPTKRPNVIDFAQMCTCIDFWSTYSPKHTPNRTSQKCIFAKLNRYRQLTTHKKWKFQ